MGDENRVRQIVANLLTNGIKYAPPRHRGARSAAATPATGSRWPSPTRARHRAGAISTYIFDEFSQAPRIRAGRRAGTGDRPRAGRRSRRRDRRDELARRRHHLHVWLPAWTGSGVSRRPCAWRLAGARALRRSPAPEVAVAVPAAAASTASCGCRSTGRWSCSSRRSARLPVSRLHAAPRARSRASRSSIWPRSGSPSATWRPSPAALPRRDGRRARSPACVSEVELRMTAWVTGPRLPLGARPRLLPPGGGAPLRCRRWRAAPSARRCPTEMLDRGLARAQHLPGRALSDDPARWAGDRLRRLAARGRRRRAARRRAGARSGRAWALELVVAPALSPAGALGAARAGRRGAALRLVPAAGAGTARARAARWRTAP